MSRERGYKSPTLRTRFADRERSVEERILKVREMQGGPITKSYQAEKPADTLYSSVVLIGAAVGASAPSLPIDLNHQFSPPSITRSQYFNQGPHLVDNNRNNGLTGNHDRGQELNQQDKPVKIEASAQISETAAVELATIFGSELEVTEPWLSENPQAIQQALEIKDFKGAVTRKLIVINNTLTGPQEKYKNSFLYESIFDKTTQEFKPYKPISQLPMQEVSSMAPIQNGDFILFGGPTGVYLYSRLGKTYTRSPLASAEDLLKIEDKIFFANNTNAQFVLEVNTTTKNINEIPVALPNIKKPEFNRLDTRAKAVQIIAAKTGVGTSGLCLATINYQNGTVYKNETLLQAELGRVDAITQVSNTLMMAVNDTRQTIYGIDVDRITGKPTEVNYTMPYKAWLNNTGIPDYFPDSFGISWLITKTDSQGGIHVWFVGNYYLNSGTIQLGIGHFVKGTDPNTDPNALFFKEVVPPNTDIVDPQFETVNSQAGLEFSATDNAGNYGGREFYPIDPSFDPNPNATAVYPNNGLQEKFYKFFAYLPIALKNYLGGW